MCGWFQLNLIDLLKNGGWIIKLKLLTAFNISGAIAVSMGSPLLANCIWSVTNPFLVWHNYKHNHTEQAVMFGVFALIAIAGVVNLAS